MRTNEQRDYTEEFTEWEQQTVSSMPPKLKRFYLSVEQDFGDYFNSWNRYQEVNKVLDGIWISGYEAPRTESFLRENKISAVLNMAIEINDPKTAGVNLFKVGIHDGVLTNVGCFEKAAEIINEARTNNENILVHCAAGISRSVTAVISYLMLYEKMGYGESIKKIREGRPQASPHHLLVRSLIRDLKSRFLL